MANLEHNREDLDVRALHSRVRNDSRISLGPMPTGGRMCTVDEQDVGAPLRTVFSIAADVLAWPTILPHYRYVRFRSRSSDGGIVEMSASRPFGKVNWPTWWVSAMVITPLEIGRPTIRFRHIEGITAGMDVEWDFLPMADGRTHVRIVHVWNGPRWPMVGAVAARGVIGPVFIHGIASRTLAGIARAAEQTAAGRVAAEPGVEGGRV